MKSAFFFTCTIALLLICCGCDRLQSKSFKPGLPGYPESGKHQVILKKSLREISGLQYLEGDSLAAINDEVGKLFIVHALTGEFSSWRFGEKGDYEDLLKIGDYFYILESKGHIHKVSAITHKEEAVYSADFGKHAEFETLYYDNSIGQIIMICKECKKNEENIPAYSFDLALGKFNLQPYFEISMDEIRKLNKNTASLFKPSAAALHPISKKLFILASVGKLLVECSSKGKPEKVYRLNPDQFLQPEGLSFAPNGDMFISNEGGEGKATLIKFSFRP